MYFQRPELLPWCSFSASGALYSYSGPSGPNPLADVYPLGFQLSYGSGHFFVDSPPPPPQRKSSRYQVTSRESGCDFFAFQTHQQTLFFLFLKYGKRFNHLLGLTTQNPVIRGANLLKESCAQRSKNKWLVRRTCR